MLHGTLKAFRYTVVFLYITAPLGFCCTCIGFQSCHTHQMGANISQRPVPNFVQLWEKVFKHSAVANGCRNIFIVNAPQPKMQSHPSKETFPPDFSLCVCQSSIHEQQEQTSTPKQGKQRQSREEPSKNKALSAEIGRIWIKMLRPLKWLMFIFSCQATSCGRAKRTLRSKSKTSWWRGQPGWQSMLVYFKHDLNQIVMVPRWWYMFPNIVFCLMKY